MDKRGTTINVSQLGADHSRFGLSSKALFNHTEIAAAHMSSIFNVFRIVHTKLFPGNSYSHIHIIAYILFRASFGRLSMLHKTLSAF